MALGNRGKQQAAAKAAPVDEFATGGEERTMAEAWVPKNAGEALMGRLVRVTDIRTKVSKGPDDLAPIAEFGPVIIRGADDEREVYANAAVMVSASLRVRINRTADIGKVFALIYRGTEPSTRGSAMHVYDVIEQKEETFTALLRKYGGDSLPF